MNKVRIVWSVILLILTTNYSFSQITRPEYLNSGLPVCLINYSPDSVITREGKLDAELTIQTPDDTVKYSVQISGRGNNTWLWNKKPYNLKFGNKVSLLGIEKCKKYALMANSCDMSLWRIAIGCELGELIDFEYTLQGKYVELVLNGTYQGNYFLVERVTRTNVPYDKDTGCILEYTYKSNVKTDGVYFTSPIKNWLFGFKDPDDPSVDGYVYNNAVKKIQQFESSVYASEMDGTNSWRNLIDWDNFVKWYYWKNIMQMQECNRYYIIENDQDETKLKMGPLWDFDWTIGRNPYNRYYSPYFKNKLFFGVIGKDSMFLQKVANYHFANRTRLEERLSSVCDSLSNLLASSEKLDAQLWNTFAVDTTNWENEMKLDRAFMHKTFMFLDQQLAPFYNAASVNAISSDDTVYPTIKMVKNNKIVIVRNGMQYSTSGIRISNK